MENKENRVNILSLLIVTCEGWENSDKLILVDGVFLSTSVSTAE